VRVLLPLSIGVASLGGILLALGCCNSRTVTQSGLVPFSEPDPPPSSHGSGDVYASGSGLTRMDATGSATSGDYVPAGQLHIGGMFRPAYGLTIRPMGMLAFSSGAGSVGTGATMATTGLPSVPLDAPTSQSFAIGVELGYVLGDEGHEYLVRPHIGVSALAIGAQVSDPVGTASSSMLGWMGVVAGGLDLGYWLTPWLLVMGSVDLRNMPELPSSVTTCFGNDPPYVNFGNLTITTRISAEVEITPGFGVFGGVAFPTYGSPYTAYPILTGGVRGSFGDGRTGMRRTRTNRQPESEARSSTWSP
jgi:hypothetical protein